MQQINGLYEADIFMSILALLYQTNKKHPSLIPDLSLQFTYPRFIKWKPGCRVQTDTHPLVKLTYKGANDPSPRVKASRSLPASSAPNSSNAVNRDLSSAFMKPTTLPLGPVLFHWLTDW